ncbi:MAG: hypothetical protein OXF40_04265 [Rhodospirillales bacterium]|nr:hypothetical protein [Rhodospirillales bacterium]
MRTYIESVSVHGSMPPVARSPNHREPRDGAPRRAAVELTGDGQDACLTMFRRPTARKLAKVDGR